MTDDRSISAFEWNTTFDNIMQAICSESVTCKADSDFTIESDFQYSRFHRRRPSFPRITRWIRRIALASLRSFLQYTRSRNPRTIACIFDIAYHSLRTWKFIKWISKKLPKILTVLYWFSFPCEHIPSESHLLYQFYSFAMQFMTSTLATWWNTYLSHMNPST